MAETAFQYAPEVIAIASMAGCHPHEVEPCVWCERIAPIRHRDCEKRPFLLVSGAFSPSGAHKTASALGEWTWRRISGGGYRVSLVTRRTKLLKAASDLRRRRYGNTPLSPDEEAFLRALQEKLKVAQHNWIAKEIWVRGVSSDLVDTVTNVIGEERGRSPHFDVCTWAPFVFGAEPKMLEPDLIAFACELHPMFDAQRSVAEQLRDAAAGRGE